MSKSADEAAEIIDKILRLYNDREGTQEEIANKINKDYNTHLKCKDIGKITKQNGDWHTVLRDKRKCVITYLDEELKKHLC